MALAAVGFVTLLAVTPADLDAQCTDCPRCGIKFEHDAPPDGDQYGTIHGPDLCLPPVACSHPPCGVGLLPTDAVRQENFDKLLHELNAGSHAAVFAILSEFPEEATVNFERRALQVYSLPGCDESAGSERNLIAHFALSEPEIAALTEWHVDRFLAALTAGQQ